MYYSETPPNSFHAYDSLQIYTNKNGARFLALAGQPVKKADVLPVDISVKESSKEQFLEALKEADISSALSSFLQEMLLKQLQD